MAANLDAQTFLRRIEILQRLPAKGTSSVAARTLTEQLRAAGYAVEKRTVERDLEFLRDHGQWFGTLHCDDRGKPYGWSIERSTARRAQMGLTVDEALGFAWLARFGRQLLPQAMVQSLGPFFQEAASRLEHDQRAQGWLRDKVRIIAARPVAPAATPDGAVTRAVSRALYEDLQLQIDYRNAQRASSQMTVSPLALVSRDMNLYLVAWISRFSNLRVLHVSRIQTAKVKEAAVERPPGFDIDAYIASGPFQLGGTDATVQLRFFDFAGHALLDAPIAADQRVISQNEEGVLELQASVRVSPQFKAWLLGYGAAAEVVAPPDLRAEVQAMLQKASSRYRSVKRAPVAKKRT
ncbi:MAG: WYL domain-containing protein [Betaproteobacteria bacterium]|nr:WYL domain-containing protein [Betaproteobacteria bacterium]